MSPRKAKPVPAQDSPGPVLKVKCPACQSEISGDGSTLHSMSKYLEDLIEDAGGVEPLGKLIESLEAQLAEKKKEKQELQETIAKLQAEVKSKHGEGKKNEGTSGDVEQGQGQQRRGSSNWW